MSPCLLQERSELPKFQVMNVKAGIFKPGEAKATTSPRSPRTPNLSEQAMRFSHGLGPSSLQSTWGEPSGG
jgi:hypothetical protein